MVITKNVINSKIIGNKVKYIMVSFKAYLLHLTLNTKPPPARVSSPNRDAAVAIASSGE